MSLEFERNLLETALSASYISMRCVCLAACRRAYYTQPPTAQSNGSTNSRGTGAHLCATYSIHVAGRQKGCRYVCKRRACGYNIYNAARLIALRRIYKYIFSARQLAIQRNSPDDESIECDSHSLSRSFCILTCMQRVADI